MLRKNHGDIITKVIVFIVGLMLMGKIFLPLLAIGISENSKNILLQILGNSSVALGKHIEKNSHEDESHVELSSYIIKNLTGLDLSTPTNFLSSQIPLLGLVDIGKIKGEHKEPIIISKEEEKPKDISKDVKQNKEPSVPAKKVDSSKPEILIYHTHATEAYNPQDLKGQNYTTDLSKTTVKIGEELKKELEEKYGIATIHDKTLHDIPKREGAYAKSRPTVQKYIKQSPNLKIIVDLHRDGFDSSKGIDAYKAFVKKTTAVINGEKYSRPMLVLGKKNKNLKQSEAFANKINSEIEKLYPNFSRGILYKEKAVFNLDLSPNMVLLEIGSNGNTVEESLRTIDIVAKVLANSIK